VEEIVQLVRKLLAENHERTFVPLREKALRVRPHSFVDLTLVDLCPWSFARFIPAEGEDCLRQIPQSPAVEIGAKHECAIECSSLFPPSARDVLADQNVTKRNFSRKKIPT